MLSVGLEQVVVFGLEVEWMKKLFLEPDTET
jgi:hypothetical protein